MQKNEITEASLAPNQTYGKRYMARQTFKLPLFANQSIDRLTSWSAIFAGSLRALSKPTNTPFVCEILKQIKHLLEELSRSIITNTKRSTFANSHCNLWATQPVIRQNWNTFLWSHDSRIRWNKFNLFEKGRDSSFGKVDHNVAQNYCERNSHAIQFPLDTCPLNRKLGRGLRVVSELFY